MRRDPGDLRPAGDPPDGRGYSDPVRSVALAPGQPTTTYTLCQQRPHRSFGKEEESLNIILQIFLVSYSK